MYTHIHTYTRTYTCTCIFSFTAYHLVTWEEEGSWSVVAGKMVAGVGDMVNIKVGRAVYKATIIESGNTVVYVCMSKVKYKRFIGSKNGHG